MTAETDTDEPLDAALAAEYALGLLEGDMKRAAHALAMGDPRFAAEVMAWQEQFARMAEAEVEPVTPSAAPQK